MNPVIEQLKRHISIRKFKNLPVEQAKIDTVLECALRASSSGNMQAYSIIVTRSEKVRKELYPLHFHQSMVLEAPLLLTFCADFYRMRKWLELSEAPQNFDNYMSFMIASIDAILASAHASIAAESLGLGLCYMGTTLANAHQIGKLLQCPKNVVPVVGFSLGYPDEEISLRDRLPLKHLVHDEKYQEYFSDGISDCYREREEKGMRRYMDSPELRSKIEGSSIKNLAQVYTKLKYTRESHQEYSKNLLNYLKEQNFFESA